MEEQVAWRVGESTAERTAATATSVLAELALTPARLRMLAFFPINA